jgi:hypothetical protein
MSFILPISQLSGTMPVSKIIKGYSTLDNLFVLFNFFEILKNKKNKIFCAFIDFEKAFDKVWRDGLWYKYKLLVNMHSGTQSCISRQNNNLGMNLVDSEDQVMILP